MAKQSTIVFEGDPVRDEANCRARCKIIYADSISSGERLQFHDELAERLSQLGDNGLSFGSALTNLCIFLDDEKRGLIREIINLPGDIETCSSQPEEAATDYATMLANADFQSASFEIRRIMTTLIREGEAKGGEYYLKTEVHNALVRFVQSPSIDTAVGLLEIAPEFLPFFLC